MENNDARLDRMIEMFIEIERQRTALQALMVEYVNDTGVDWGGTYQYDPPIDPPDDAAFARGDSGLFQGVSEDDDQAVVFVTKGRSNGKVLRCPPEHVRAIYVEYDNLERLADEHMTRKTEGRIRSVAQRPPDIY